MRRSLAYARTIVYPPRRHGEADLHFIAGEDSAERLDVWYWRRACPACPARASS